MASLSLRLRCQGARLVLAVWLAVSLGGPAIATTWDIAATTGVMQQPTSHYYLGMYGVTADLGTDSQKLMARISYLERPKFKSAGFVDQDFGWFGLVGTKVTKEKDRGLYAFFGFGRMGGTVKLVPSGAPPPAKTTSSYLINGPTAALEYAVHFGHFYVALGHQTFIGYVDQDQLNAFVAWPYNFFQLNAGVTW